MMMTVASAASGIKWKYGVRNIRERMTRRPGRCNTQVNKNPSVVESKQIKSKIIYCKLEKDIHTNYEHKI